jgi:hypothetical protein
MKKTFLVTFALTTILTVAHALDLEPREMVVDLNGPRLKRYFFQDENKRLLFRIDGRMSVTGSSNQALFHFSDIPHATMKLSKSGTAPDTSFESQNLDLYRASARSFVSAQAKEVRIVEETKDTLPINGWTSYQFVLTYKLFGFPFRQSITFFNYTSTEQLVFDVMAPEKEYEKTYNRSYRVLNSFGAYVPGQESGST